MRDHTKLRAFELADEVAVTEKVLNGKIIGEKLTRRDAKDAKD